MNLSPDLKEISLELVEWWMDVNSIAGAGIAAVETAQQ